MSYSLRFEVKDGEVGPVTIDYGPVPDGRYHVNGHHDTHTDQLGVQRFNAYGRLELGSSGSCTPPATISESYPQ